MFERYTQHARRVIFFAREEASALHSGFIDTEHLLLGLLREDKVLALRLPPQAQAEIRREIEQRLVNPARWVPLSVDLPLSDDSKRALAYSSEEANRLNHKSIDCGHLVLGLLSIENCAAAQVLRQHGIDLGRYRGLVLNWQSPTDPAARAIERPSAWHQPQTTPSAAPSLEAPFRALQDLVDSTVHHLAAYSESYGEERLKRKPWSRKEALGHLIDCATTHQHWFARALTQPKVVAGGYPQEEWVSAQQYRNFSWQDLVDLWVLLNRLLIHVLAGIPEDKLSTPCHIGIEAPIALSGLIARYVAHCEDVVGQILARL